MFSGPVKMFKVQWKVHSLRVDTERGHARNNYKTCASEHSMIYSFAKFSFS